jgi:Protein of unknown function (DUF4012)
MPRRLWAVALLAPFALVALGTQVAIVTGLAGIAQAGWGARGRDSADVYSGVATMELATRILARTWSSPAAWLLDHNPITLGAVDDLGAASRALEQSATALTPLARIGTEALGFDGDPPMVRGTTIDTSRIADLAGPVRELHESLASAAIAAERVPGSGLLGRPIGAIADSAQAALSDLSDLSGAAELAWPDLPDALGANEPRRYLVCALNDAESFGSGGAPLSALVVEAVRGTVSVPISGQLESKLSPNNPPIVWQHAGGPPWYRKGKTYPFVNSNFHPDFRTASIDMRRAWAALGYPEVQGVITIDVSALATLLAWTGPVETTGFGTVGADNLITKVLVDAYRDFNSPEGVAERHTRNDALTTSLVDHLTAATNLLGAARGTMDAIPPRHIQASFDNPSLQRAVVAVGAQAALSAGPGDLVGAFSQSGPNKLTVFQDRTITQEVVLSADGGAEVRRTIQFVNDVPPGLEGDPSTYAGYLALRARMRVAYRVPLSATDFRISTGTSVALVPEGRTGPFPDDRGGAVLWQGHETAPGDSTTVEMYYRLPAGTFPPGTYRVSADPQALPRPVQLRMTVSAGPGVELPDSPGWTREGTSLVWSGTLDRPISLEIG